jgi:L-asparaginase
MPEKRRPRIAILATGGTIAGASQAGANTAYTSGSLTATQLLDAIPSLAAHADLLACQVANVGSQNMTHDVWWTLLCRIDALNADDAIDAIVVTHGTDTLEETAYFLSLTARREKPLVLVGAMLPATARDADGPRNLYAAILTACALHKRGDAYGPIVAMQDILFLARDIQKIASSGLYAFGAPNAAPIGRVQGDSVQFATPPTPMVGGVPAFPSIAPPHLWPDVGIVYAHANMGAEVIDFLAGRVKGLVLAGVGNGNATDAALTALARAIVNGVSVVRATRTGSGRVDRNIELDDDAFGFIAAGDLSPQKARILLMLALTQPTTPGNLQLAFTLN